MKKINQISVIIPAYNEENAIVSIINRVPHQIIGIKPQILVINDGSTDRTKIVSENAGAHVISHPKNLGLGASLRTGLKEALMINSDLIIQIDADGQYLPEEIPKLIQPIINNEADLVLGSRFDLLGYKMPKMKKMGNKFVTFIVNQLTNARISDAQTGFRAISRELAEILLIKLHGIYTYTQEMVIHTIFNNFRISEIPITFNQRIDGESRLIQNIFSYFYKILKIVIKTYHEYKPLRFYGKISAIIFVFGLILLLIDNYFSLQGIHLIPTINLSPEPKTLLTIFLPLFIGFLLFLFGIILEMQKNTRNDIFQLEQQIKALLEEKLKDLKDEK